MASPILLLLLLLFLFNINFINSLDVSIGGSNGGISIGIGGSTPDSPSPVSSPPGNGTPSDCSPPQPNSPPPFLFLDERLRVVYPFIQNFKNKITSDPMGVTKTWNGSDICKYRGFYCDNPPDNASAIALASIDFNGFGLAASSLEGFIENLKDLALFHANSNFFTGTISPKIANLPYLYEFDISNNRFTGSFPPALLAATNITFLDIRYNTFSGSVPAPIFSRQLDVLFVNNNNFLMKLPENFGLTTALYLTLANNKFIGSIPKSIGKASGLTEILFLNNQLSGCLPYEIGYLNKLTVFDVGYNRLTGPIPCSFGCLDKIEQLNLAGNMFYGMVPEVVCALGNLANLSLSDNYFTHVGPYCWRLIQSGVLDAKKNCIHGLPRQRSIGECAAFFSQPRGCPYMASYIYLPCRPPQPWMQENTYSHSLPPAKAPSPSYTALIRHRL